MAPRTKIEPEQAPFLICNTSFIGFYDGDGFRQFVAVKGRTIIASDSKEATLWGDAVDRDGTPLFMPIGASMKAYLDPYVGVEQATAAPGERRGD